MLFISWFINIFFHLFFPVSFGWLELMMNFLHCSLLYYFILITQVNVNGQGCDKKCSEPIPNHYYELGCHPIYNETNCCPIR